MILLPRVASRQGLLCKKSRAKSATPIWAWMIFKYGGNDIHKMVRINKQQAATFHDHRTAMMMGLLFILAAILPSPALAQTVASIPYDRQDGCGVAELYQFSNLSCVSCPNNSVGAEDGEFVIILNR